MGSLVDIIKVPVMSIDALGTGFINSFRNVLDYVGNAFSSSPK